MYETMYLIVAALASVCLLLTFGLYRWHEEVELFAALSTVFWAVLAFASDNVVVVTNSGTTVTQSSVTMQYLSVGLALVSFIAIVVSWTGDWPANKEQQQGMKQ